MNTKLSVVSDKRIYLNCSACGHTFSYQIADLILATSDDTTTHEVRQKAVCGVVVLEDITPIRWFSEGCASLLFKILSPISKIKHNNFGY